MKQFDIYFGEMHNPEFDDGKNRPVAILELSEEFETLSVLGVYSFKKWFDEKPEFIRDLYEIKDIEEAGLDLLKKSFIKVSRIEELPSYSAKNYKYLGHLSERDIDGLLNLIDEYYA